MQNAITKTMTKTMTKTAADAARDTAIDTARVKKMQDLIAKNDQVSLKEVLGSDDYTGAFVTACLKDQKNYFKEYKHLLSEEFYSNLFKCPEIFNNEGYIHDIICCLPGVEISEKYGSDNIRYKGKEVSSIYLNTSKHAQNYWKDLGGLYELTREEFLMLEENASHTALKYLDIYEGMQFENEQGRFDEFVIPRGK